MPEALRSVGAKIAVAFALMVPIIALALGMNTFDAFSRYRAAIVIDRQNSAANGLIAGVYEILMERLATNNALQAADPTNSDVLKEIATRRSAAVTKISAAYEELGAQAFSNRQSLLSELKAAIDKADSYRSKADVAVKQKSTERDADTVKNLFVALSELSAASQKVWSAVLSNTAHLDPELARLTNLRVLGWNLRDIAGLERSHIGQAIAAKTAVPVDKLAAIGEIRSQITLMWRLVQINLAEREHPAITRGIELAKDGYFGKFQPLADQMRKISGEGAAYPVSVSQWVDTTTPQLFTLLEIMYGAGAASEAHTNALLQSAIGSLWLNVTLLVLATGMAAGAAWLAVRTVVRPLAELSGVVGKLGHGEQVTIPHLDRTDEIGQMALALKSFDDNSASMEAIRRDQTAAQEVQVKRADRLSKLTADFERTVGGIVDVVATMASKLEQAAGTLTKTADTTQQLSATVSATSDDASKNVQSVASATDEMSASISEIGQRVQESSGIANEAVRQASQTDARINQLSQAATRIGDVVKLITAIAEQTNLLALNATIEAARAGEAGKGFAVVAQEVKALAAQTAKATGEISTQIADMQSATQDSVAAIKEISGTIGRISEIATVIAAAVQQQGAATQEISRNVQQATHGVSQMTRDITHVNQGAAQTGSASAEVLASAKSLASESHHLKTEVQNFLQTVRAA